MPTTPLGAPLAARLHGRGEQPAPALLERFSPGEMVGAVDSNRPALRCTAIRAGTGILIPVIRAPSGAAQRSRCRLALRGLAGIALSEIVQGV